MKTLPKVGHAVLVAGIALPLIVEACSEATRTASLKGEHPETGMEVVLPRVCVSLLRPQPKSVAQLEQELADVVTTDVAIHLFVKHEEFEYEYIVENTLLRTKILSSVIDVVGAQLEVARQAAAKV